jgi:uncharacterized protein
MRISNTLIGTLVTGFGLLLVLGLGLAPTLPFDGVGSPPAPQLKSTTEALGSSIPTFKGDSRRGAASLENAAENGNQLALWQLGHMYAKGDGVPADDYRAFEYFQKFADRNANVNPVSQSARYVADAFIVLARYHLSGIPNSPVTANAGRAQRMLTHAASYFGDPEAQYQLARMHLDGKSSEQDPKRAMPWLVMAAKKRHYEAQALLGRILFQGEHGRRQPASGLMWLIIAYDGPGANVPWIAELHESAFKQASEKERAQALALLERWVEGQR